MPMYEYKCDRCGDVFEVIQKFVDEPLQQHEGCGGHVERLLSAPSQSDQPALSQLRDKAILELFFSTGMRVSELATLKRDQINLKKDEWSIRGKGRKVRTVFITNQARYFLEAYLNARRDPSPFVFIRHDRAAANADRALPAN